MVAPMRSFEEKISGIWLKPRFLHIYLKLPDKCKGWMYKRPVGQRPGVGDTLHLRTKILWSGHIAAET